MRQQMHSYVHRERLGLTDAGVAQSSVAGVDEFERRVVSDLLAQIHSS